MAKQITEPEAPANTRIKTYNCYDEIVKTFKEEDVVHMLFEVIPTGLFPCKFGTKHSDYNNTFSFIASFDKEKHNVTTNLKKAFEELTSNVYPFKKDKHPVIAGMKWVSHPDWLKPKRVYRVTFGQCSSKDPELIQVIFCHQNDFNAMIDNFEGLYFLKA